jgi:hypothetical protein
MWTRERRAAKRLIVAIALISGALAPGAQSAHSQAPDSRARRGAVIHQPVWRDEPGPGFPDAVFLNVASLHSRSTQACARRGIARTPSLATISIMIDMTGRVSRVSVRADERVVARCLEDAILRWRFPQSAIQTDRSYSLALTPR